MIPSSNMVAVYTCDEGRSPKLMLSGSMFNGTGQSMLIAEPGLGLVVSFIILSE